MQAVSLDSFEKNGLESLSLDRAEKLSELNKAFKTSVKPENGSYGVTIVDKGNGLTEHISRNELGHIKKEYFTDDKLTLIREKISDNDWRKTFFDDNGTPYLKETMEWGKRAERVVELEPNTVIRKGNFTSITDQLGRPIENKIEHIKLSPGRESLNGILKNDSYLENDHRGHAIADIFGGPSSPENIVPQMDEVNLSKIKTVENKVKKLVEDGHDVTLIDKMNYDESGKRPSSFEYRIISDGEEVELEDGLKKIYNRSLSRAGELFTDVKEKTYSVAPNAMEIGSAGLDKGFDTAVIMCISSAIDNYALYSAGEITAEEMVQNIAKDSGKGAFIGFGVGSAEKGMAILAEKTGSEFLQSASSIGIPAEGIAMGIKTIEVASAYFKGEMELSEVAYQLGEKAASYGGYMAGAVIGTAIMPGAGTIVGGMVGCALSTETYKLAVAHGAEGAEKLGNKAKDIANATIEYAQENIPEKVADIKTAFNSFAAQNNLPFSFA